MELSFAGMCFTKWNACQWAYYGYVFSSLCSISLGFINLLGEDGCLFIHSIIFDKESKGMRKQMKPCSLYLLMLVKPKVVQLCWNTITPRNNGREETFLVWFASWTKRGFWSCFTYMHVLGWLLDMYSLQFL
jgi:hypothetical protein